MRSGKLFHVITVQRFTDTLDEHGTPSLAWSDLMTLRAEIVQQSTAEYIRNQGASDEAIVIFRTRFAPGITNADRIMHRGTAHNIREVAVHGRDRELELRTVSVLGAA